MKKIRWGIVGTGSIAEFFAKELDVLDDAELVAVSSRKQATADAFAEEFGAQFAHVGVELLAANENVDAVYIATPHPAHKNEAIICMEQGKAVLCEKPLTMNAAESTEMIECAARNKVFMMEAMWTHFFPQMAKVRELISSGAIGEVKMVNADFCYCCDGDPESRLMNPKLGGGAILDAGVYPISFAQMVFAQTPSKVTSVAHIGKTGVDEYGSVTLGYDGGGIAILNFAVRSHGGREAFIYGSKGHISIPDHFWHPKRILFKIGDGDEEEFSVESTGHGYEYEIREAMRCMREGILESPIMPHDKTLSVMKIMDEARAQWTSQ